MSLALKDDVKVWNKKLAKWYSSKGKRVLGIALNSKYTDSHGKYPDGVLTLINWTDDSVAKTTHLGGTDALEEAEVHEIAERARQSNQLSFKEGDDGLVHVRQRSSQLSGSSEILKPRASKLALLDDSGDEAAKKTPKPRKARASIADAVEAMEDAADAGDEEDGNGDEKPPWSSDADEFQKKIKTNRDTTTALTCRAECRRVLTLLGDIDNLQGLPLGAFGKLRDRIDGRLKIDVVKQFPMLKHQQMVDMLEMVKSGVSPASLMEHEESAVGVLTSNQCFALESHLRTFAGAFVALVALAKSSRSKTCCPTALLSDIMACKGIKPSGLYVVPSGAYRVLLEKVIWEDISALRMQAVCSRLKAVCDVNQLADDIDIKDLDSGLLEVDERHLHRKLWIQSAFRQAAQMSDADDASVVDTIGESLLGFCEELLSTDGIWDEINDDMKPHIADVAKVASHKSIASDDDASELATAIDRFKSPAAHAALKLNDVTWSKRIVDAAVQSNLAMTADLGTEPELKAAFLLLAAMPDTLTIPFENFEAHIDGCMSAFDNVRSLRKNASAQLLSSLSAGFDKAEVMRCEVNTYLELRLDDLFVAWLFTGVTSEAGRPAADTMPTIAKTGLSDERISKITQSLDGTYDADQPSDLEARQIAEHAQFQSRRTTIMDACNVDLEMSQQTCADPVGATPPLLNAITCAA